MKANREQLQHAARLQLGSLPFSLKPREACGRIEHSFEIVTVGQFAFFGGDAASDLFELLPPGQVVLDDDEVLLAIR